MIKSHTVREREREKEREIEHIFDADTTRRPLMMVVGDITT